MPIYWDSRPRRVENPWGISPLSASPANHGLRALCSPSRDDPPVSRSRRPSPCRQNCMLAATAWQSQPTKQAPAEPRSPLLPPCRYVLWFRAECAPHRPRAEPPWPNHRYTGSEADGKQDTFVHVPLNKLDHQCLWLSWGFSLKNEPAGYREGQSRRHYSRGRGQGGAGMT